MQWIWMVTCACLTWAASFGTLPDARPDPSKRKFNSTSVNTIISEFRLKMKDEDLGTLFANAFPNALDTTVVEWGYNDSFIITGDIDALWLRDSTNQVMPYLRFMREDSGLRDLVHGLVMKQARSVNEYAYGNAFNLRYTGSHSRSPQDICHPNMTAGVWESKYELDSLSAVVKLSFRYYNATGDASLLRDPDWLSAMRTIVNVVRGQQNSTLEDGPNPAYTFFRKGIPAWNWPTIQYPDPKRPAQRCGLSKCGFRPSDDPTQLPFLVPANAMAATELQHLANMLAQEQPELSQQAAILSQELRAAVRVNATVNTPQDGVQVLAFEVDGFGNHTALDDANIPSLLSLPYLGFVPAGDDLYQSTRQWILSPSNPYYIQGKAGKGPGSPHTGDPLVNCRTMDASPSNMIWPMGLIMQAMTSTNDTEISICLDTLKTTTGGTGLMHERFHKDDPTCYARPWFAWANSLFGELILKLAEERPHLIFGDPYEVVT